MGGGILAGTAVETLPKVWQTVGMAAGLSFIALGTGVILSFLSFLSFPFPFSPSPFLFYFYRFLL